MIRRGKHDDAEMWCENHGVAGSLRVARANEARARIRDDHGIGGSRVGPPPPPPPPSALGLSWAETRRADVWPVACAQCLRCELQLSFLTTASVISRTSRLASGMASEV